MYIVVLQTKVGKCHLGQINEGRRTP